MKQFSEATRVQMPAMVHLTRIGYTYFGKLSEDKNGTVYDGDTNILLQVFERQFKKMCIRDSNIIGYSFCTSRQLFLRSGSVKMGLS